MWRQAQRVKTADQIVQEFVEFALTWFEDRNYTLTVDADMEGWARVMRTAPSIAVVNPTFDPEFSPLSPNNSFWLNVRAGSQTVATSAARLFVTEDYLELKRSVKLWYDPPRSSDARLVITVPSDTPAICGKVGHEGGLWVHPGHRNLGLSVILPHLTRALSLRQWNVDWQTGAAMRGIGESGLPKRAYGMPHVVACFEGFFVVTQRPDRLYLAYMSQKELLAGLDLDTVAGLLANGHRKMSHATARI
jgi:hypothetical protein